MMTKENTPTAIFRQCHFASQLHMGTKVKTTMLSDNKKLSPL